MKHGLFLLFIVALISVFSCNKVAKEYYINFEIPYEQTVDVPNGGYEMGSTLPPGGVWISYPTYPVVTGIDTMLDKYNAQANKVVRVTLLLSSLQIVVPPDLTFNYLDSFQLFISATGLPEQMIAYHYNVPKSVRMFDLQKVTDLNLRDYITKDTVYFRINTHINTPTPPDEKIKVKTLFHIQANPVI